MILKPRRAHLQGGLAGAASDLEEPVTWVERRKTDQVVEQLGWVIGTGSMVETGRGFEGLAQVPACRISVGHYRPG